MGNLDPERLAGDQRLTEREKKALQALIDKRKVYLASGHGIAGKALGVAIWLVWQVFTHVEAPDA
jgi:uroporphyrinogen-III decarboxylase